MKMSLTFAAAALSVASAVGAQAAPEVCGKYDEIQAQLERQYGESRKAVGLAASGNLVVVLASDNGSTWTILVARPNGFTCLLAAGESWQETKPNPAPAGIEN